MGWQVWSDESSGEDDEGEVGVTSEDVADSKRRREVRERTR